MESRVWHTEAPLWGVGCGVTRFHMKRSCLDDNTLWLGPSSSDTTTRYVFTCIDLRVRPEAVAKEQAVRGDTGDGALEILVPTGQGAGVRVRG